MLHHVVENPVREGPAPDDRVVLVHGFTQTLRSWDPVVAGLAAHRAVVRVDLPGHGGSSALRMRFTEAATVVGETGGAAVYVGYSLGGRLCLRLALDRPDLVRALVLVSASPGIDDAAQRAARRRDDELLARQLESEGTPDFMERWLQQPMFAGLHPSAADRAARDSNPPDGLAAGLRLLGPGAQEPLWDRLAELDMPVLFVVGEHDTKFGVVADRMAAAVPRPSLARIPGAGHAAHLERPREWTEAVTAFLDEHQTS
ncbi:MAG: alpha/beta fold hydrolase [Actinomycetota bacterium]|nr:alpha/beta fold hydrolase [Actinomycetota bacterium]